MLLLLEVAVTVLFALAPIPEFVPVPLKIGLPPPPLASLRPMMFPSPALVALSTAVALPATPTLPFAALLMRAPPAPPIAI